VCLGAIVLYISGVLLFTNTRNIYRDNNVAATSPATESNAAKQVSTTVKATAAASSSSGSGSNKAHVDTGSALDVNTFTDHRFPAEALSADEAAASFINPVGENAVGPIVKRIEESMSSKKDVIVIGIAGGSGSGKTTLANAIYKAIGKENISFLCHDSYYRDLSHLPMEQREKNNFDHPDSLETELLIEHILALKNKQDVMIPTYDFSTHSRRQEQDHLIARPVVLVEGILIFSDPKLYSLLDIRIFVDTDDDIRFIRRVSRDTKERGRTLQGVIDQYISTVRPMHLQFVEPSKRNADIIVPVGLNSVALDLVVSRLKDHLNA
jgi:uridine kinase